MAKLTEEERAAALPDLAARDWGRPEGRDAIAKRFRFAGFAEAWGFMSAVAITAEAMNHHPEWRNVWATVEVTLITHDADGLTARDLTLATAMDRLAGGAKTKPIGAPLV
jgi:4a-hydroxytetrahydrobiopterin dehydratase